MSSVKELDNYELIINENKGMKSLIAKLKHDLAVERKRNTALLKRMYKIQYGKGLNK